MPLPRTTKSKVLFVLLTVGAFLIPAKISSSPKPSPQQGHLVPPNPSEQYPMTVEVLNSQTDGADVRPYVDTIYFSIRNNLLANISKSVAIEETGILVVRIQIQEDGSVPEKSMRIIFKAGKVDMDDAVLSAIRTAAPFKHVPGSSKLELLLTFYFRSTPPAQKPKFVPVGI